jgi:hypothetical protein
MDPSTFLKALDAADGGRAHHARRSVQSAAPSAQSNLVADPNGLMARALAILAEDNRMSGETQSPQRANITREFRTQSADLALQRRILSDGTECPLPVRYFDVQCLVATFLTELDRAVELVKRADLQVVPQEDGKAVVKLFCIEYRKTDLGPYNEVGLTVLTMAPGDFIPANYVLNLPVTTEVANRAGREIWGYNKFVATIDVNSDGKKFSTFLRDTENEMIGALEGRRSASIPVPPADIITFTLLKGRVIKTLIQVLTPSYASSGDSFMFKVGKSKHPMANNLRTLALDEARPVLVDYADPFQALLFPGRPI